MDMQQCLMNRQQFPSTELAKYAGKYIAWSPDGTRILASDDDLAKVAAAVEDLGYDSSEIVLSSVPFPDEVVLGGGAFFRASRNRRATTAGPLQVCPCSTADHRRSRGDVRVECRRGFCSHPIAVCPDRLCRISEVFRRRAPRGRSRGPSEPQSLLPRRCAFERPLSWITACDALVYHDHIDHSDLWHGHPPPAGP